MRARKPLVITDEQRSMIAGLLVVSGDCHSSRGVPCSHCLCCAAIRQGVAARIVGKRYAEALCSYAQRRLGCGFNHDREVSLTNWEQTYLDKISTLEELV